MCMCIVIYILGYTYFCYDCHYLWCGVCVCVCSSSRHFPAAAPSMRTSTDSTDRTALNSSESAWAKAADLLKHASNTSSVMTEKAINSLRSRLDSLEQGVLGVDVVGYAHRISYITNIPLWCKCSIDS